MRQTEMKHASLKQAAAMVSDGAILALGGSETARQPMALVREIIRQGKKGLHLCGYRQGADFDMLARSGCVATLDAPVSADPLHGNGVVSKPIGRAAAFVRFEAAAADLPYALVKPEAMQQVSDSIVAVEDVFGGEAALAVRRLDPDIAIIHAHAADIYGNVQMDIKFHADFVCDLVLARAAKCVIVSVEQIVSPQSIVSAPWKTVLPAKAVACVVEAPYGALPTACEGRYQADEDALAEYAKASRQALTAQQWFDAHVHASGSHALYLDRLGMKHIQSLTVKKPVRV